MIEKELHKLKRQEVLQLLLVQVQEAEELQKKLDETVERLQETEELCKRLKERLDNKDAQIDRLKGRLEQKDVRIHDLRMVLEGFQKDRLEDLQEAGSIAEAALELSGIFEAAQKAADIYLESVSRFCEKKKGDRS